MTRTVKVPRDIEGERLVCCRNRFGSAIIDGEWWWGITEYLEHLDTYTCFHCGTEWRWARDHEWGDYFIKRSGCWVLADRLEPYLPAGGFVEAAMPIHSRWSRLKGWLRRQVPNGYQVAMLVSGTGFSLMPLLEAKGAWPGWWGALAVAGISAFFYVMCEDE